MKKQTMMQATMIMVGVGFITKILGIINRILITRSLGEEGVGVYSLISPTITLLATIAMIGLPVAVPALIARGEIKERKILWISLLISLSLSIFITFGMLLVARPIANYMLKDIRLVYPLMMIGPLLFAICFTSILKSYFQGKENMTPGAVCTLVEQIVRMSLTVLLIGWFLPRGIEFAIIGLMLASIIGEMVSGIILIIMFFQYKRKTYPQSETLVLPKLEPVNFKDILAISLPTTGSRLIGSFTHFLEPIIVVQVLFHMGYSANESAQMFGAIQMFAIPLLFMPSFISQAVAAAIIPVIGRAFKNKDYPVIHHRLSTAFKINFFTCGFYLVLVMIFPYEIMNLLYHSDTGAEFLLVMAPVFLLLYLQSPLIAALQAMGEAKFAMRASLVASVVKIGLMSVLMLIPGMNIWGFLYAMLFNIILLTGWYYVILKRRTAYVANYWKSFIGLLSLAILFVGGLHLRQILPIDNDLHLVIVISAMLFIAHTIFSYLTGLFPKESSKLQS